MNNKEKWRKTRKVIFRLSKELQEEMRIETFKGHLVTKNSILARLKDLNQKDTIVVTKEDLLIFSSSNFGHYIEVVYKKRRRLNVVPMCFLVQLYNEQFATIDESEKNENWIPFDLRSFWKMSKAIDLVADLSKLHMGQKLLLQNLQHLSWAEEKQESIMNGIEDTMKIVNALEILPPENGKIEIHFLESKFILNTRNVKLDIVPLCKLLVKYYIQFITSMENTFKTYEECLQKRMVFRTEYEMEAFMKRYFTSGQNY